MKGITYAFLTLILISYLHLSFIFFKRDKLLGNSSNLLPSFGRVASGGTSQDRLTGNDYFG